MATTEVRSSNQVFVDDDFDVKVHKIKNLLAGTVTGNAVEFDQLNTAISTAVNPILATIHAPTADLTAAKAVASAARANAQTMLIETLGLFWYDADNAAASNDDTIIRPGDIASDATVGRWVRHYQTKLYQPDGTNPFVYTDNSGQLHIDGNIIQHGAAYETHAEHVLTTNDQIILRDGAVAALATGAYAGFKAKLYDGVNDGYLVFDNTGTARVGDVGSQQPIATRIETPTNGHYAIWDGTNLRLNFAAAGLAAVGNGSAQYQIPVTGATTFSPGWTTAANLVGASGLNALSYVSASFIKMTAANTFALRTLAETLSDLGAAPAITGGYLPLSAGPSYPIMADLNFNSSVGINFQYAAAASSRSWNINHDNGEYGDFHIQRSTTRTGSTFEDILKFSFSGAATFISTVTASNGVLIGGAGVLGQVSFWTGTNTQSGDAGLLWNNTNKRLGVTATGFNGVVNVAHLTNSDWHLGSGASLLLGSNSVEGQGNARITGTGYVGNDYRSHLQLQTTTVGGVWNVGIFMDYAGYVGIGYNDASPYRLKVNGSGYFNGDVVIYAPTGLTIDGNNAASQLYFKDQNVPLGSLGKGNYSVSGGDSTGISMYSVGAMSFATGGQTERVKITNTGVVNIYSTTVSTSSSTGALVVAGGLGVVGAINACGLKIQPSGTSGYFSVDSVGYANQIQIGTNVANGYLFINGNLVPATDNNQNLGTSGYRWKNLSLSGDASITSLAGTGNRSVYVDSTGKLCASATGSGLAGNRVYRATPSGTINGTNPTFTITGVSIVTGSEEVFKNGQLMTAGSGLDYTIAVSSGNTIITFETDSIPSASGATDVIRVNYTPQ